MRKHTPLTQHRLNRRAAPRLVVAALFAGAMLPPLSYASQLSVGDLAPNFTLKTVKGENLRRSEHAGNVMALLFTASWCGTCNDALRKLQTLNTTFQPYGFKAWGIDLDTEKEKTLSTSRQLALDYPLLYDDEGTVSKQFWIDDLPALFILDRDGRIRQIIEGDDIQNAERLADTIKAIAEE